MKFRPSQVWKMLKANGISPAAERDYSILSATAHASTWGARYYGRTVVGDPSRLYLSLAPIYDATAAFMAGIVLQGTYPRPIHAFLVSCTVSRAPKSLWRSIKSRYEALIDDWQSKMDFDSWFWSEMDRANERVLHGKKPEAVLKEMGKRFEEKYGKDDDAS